MKLKASLVVVMLVGLFQVACQSAGPTVVGKPVFVSDDPLMVAIHTARELPFYRDRREVLNDLAKRNDLREPVQIALIDATMVVVAREDGREKVLGTLIANPVLTIAAGEHLLSRIDSLKYPGTRQRLLQALQEHNWPK
jgi:hypothetical protein